MTPKEALAQAYTTLAPFSSRFNVDCKRMLYSITRLCECAGGVAGKQILDVGGGIGLMTYALTLLGAHATGIDKYLFDPDDTLFHLSDIEKLKEVWKREKIDMREVDFFDTNVLAEDSFDIVMSEAMIEHMRDPRAFLDRMYRLTRRGGYMLIATPNLTTMLRRIRFLFGLSPMWELKQFFELGERFTGHWREYTLSELCTMCEWSGFEVVNAWNKNMLAPFKWSKLPRFVARLISSCVPGSRDMNFVVGRKAV